MRKAKSKKHEETASTDFATTLAELEKVVADLDSDIAIEKALALFERGMQLSNECEKFLSATEQKVNSIIRKVKSHQDARCYHSDHKLSIDHIHQQ